MLSNLNLVSAFERACKTFGRIGIGKIPYVKRVYRFFYHLLDELPWLWHGKNIMKIEGSKMYMNPRAKPPFRAAFRAYIRSPKEKLTTDLFKKVVKEGEIVVDLGANIGYFTLLAARLVGKKGKVYAFEPEPGNYNMLLKNIELNGYDNIVPVQKAVSNVSGVVRLYLSNKDIGAHTIRQYHDKSQFAERQFGEFLEVESVTLDEFFEDKKHPIDVIKIDIEGAEMVALLGMDKIIRGNESLKMFIEFYPSAIREMGYSPEEFTHRLLENYTFSILGIDELRMPTNQYLKINNVDALMNLCKEEEKIVNLFLERNRGLKEE